jgi:hypothetical protein
MSTPFMLGEAIDFAASCLLSVGGGDDIPRIFFGLLTRGPGARSLGLGDLAPGRLLRRPAG